MSGMCESRSGTRPDGGRCWEGRARAGRARFLERPAPQKGAPDPSFLYLRGSIGATPSRLAPLVSACVAAHGAAQANEQPLHVE